ncbi:prepilin-type N-terminal cleavage/methylation domain-containing protein [Pannus brasiliensis CCIBt3594]|uniref:Prepilin-type N-terminal cleavage/methylation domain-containing protein n=1 Tax=Pannus brasiliensis CCIBt3594 TaxID=1427578 RepID=A0AAW9QVG9_9CHRO
MRRLLTPEHRGLTLMETLIVIILIGVLAAMGAPHVFATLSGNRVRQGVGIVRTALQDAQLQAIRLGKKCTVELGQESGSTSNYFDRLRATPVGCFVAGETTTETTTVGGTTTTYQVLRLPRGVKVSVSSNGSGTIPSFRFSFKGHIIDYSSLAVSGQIPTFVVFAVDESTDSPFTSDSYPKKCLMVASMLGMIRGGNYRNATTANALASAQVSSTNCDALIEGR